MDTVSLLIQPPIGAALVPDATGAVPIVDTIKDHDNAIRPALCTLLVASHILKLSVETTYTAAVLLHRYQLSIRIFGGDGGGSSSNNQDDDRDRRWIVAACLYLACKSEEETRRFRDVINCAEQIRVVAPALSLLGASKDKSQQLAMVDDFGNTTIQIQWNPDPPPLDETYWQAKAKLVRVEQIVLRWLAFDVTVSHPHRAVVVLLSDLLLKYQQKQQQRHQEEAPSTLQNEDFVIAMAAWQRLNDSIFSIACLQCTTLSLAVAAIRLAIISDCSGGGVHVESNHKDGTLKDLILNVNYWKEMYGIEQNEILNAEGCLCRVTEELARSSTATAPVIE